MGQSMGLRAKTARSSNMKRRGIVRRLRNLALINWEVTNLDRVYDGADQIAAGDLLTKPSSKPQNQRPREPAGLHTLDPLLSADSQS